MIFAPTKLFDRHRPPFDLNLTRLVDVRDLELTFAECFDDGRFYAADLWMEGWNYQFLIIVATDGFGFAELVGRTDNGRAVLRPAVALGAAASEPAEVVPEVDAPARRGPGRPPKHLQE